MRSARLLLWIWHALSAGVALIVILILLMLDSLMRAVMGNEEDDDSPLSMENR